MAKSEGEKCGGEAGHLEELGTGYCYCRALVIGPDKVISLNRVTSPLLAVREVVALGLEMERHSQDYFRCMARPPEDDRLPIPDHVVEGAHEP